tara:strand:+ start:39 stop:299 length:261 start_codon:yes stop_codon:yes gene_type:complete
MKDYVCTALIRYSKQEVEVHINALKIALQGDKLTNYRGPYLNLLKDMQRIKDQMIDKENDARADKKKEKEIILESSVMQGVPNETK